MHCQEPKLHRLLEEEGELSPLARGKGDCLWVVCGLWAQKTTSFIKEDGRYTLQVFEVAGAPAAVKLAVSLCAPGGTVVLLGRLGFQKWFFEVGGVVVPKVYDLLFWIIRSHSRLEDL